VSEVSISNQALSVHEFRTLMDPLGPFEATPFLAVATSGGADSIALCILADRWARARRGKIIALVVDHRLRKGSYAEAQRVKSQLENDLGITARVLRGYKSSSGANVQAKARAMRYRLMCDWCVRYGILHLLLGHHREDQAETFLLRLIRGSGVEGLAAMSSVSELMGVRILRPFLTTSKLRLKTTVTDARQLWLEDPSNADRKFSRVRIRQLSHLLEEEGLESIRITNTAYHIGRARDTLEDSQADLLARALTLNAAGYGILNTQLFKQARRETALRALARVLICISGRDHSPRFVRLERLYTAIMKGQGHPRTLHGCRLAGYQGELLVCREVAAVCQTLPIENGQELIWDRRYRVSLVSPVCDSTLYVAKLGRIGLRQIIKEAGINRPSMPSAVCVSLPALWCGEGVLAVPYLRGVKEHLRPMEKFNVTFRPFQPMMSRFYTLA